MKHTFRFSLSLICLLIVSSCNINPSTDSTDDTTLGANLGDLAVSELRTQSQRRNSFDLRVAENESSKRLNWKIERTSGTKTLQLRDIDFRLERNCNATFRFYRFSRLSSGQDMVRLNEGESFEIRGATDYWLILDIDNLENCRKIAGEFEIRER